MDVHATLAEFSIGVVGMDQLGAALLERLERQGIGHTSTDLDHRLVQAHLADGGSAPVGSPYDIAQMCNLIILAAPDGESLRENVMGSVGLIHKIQPGTIIIDMSDAPPDVGLALARSLVSRGAIWIEATTMSAPEAARAGELTLLCGGPQAAFERVLPVLQIFGSQIVRLGDLGSGGMARLLGTALTALSTAVHTEMMTFARRQGLDPNGILQALPLIAPGSGAPPPAFAGEVLSGRYASGTPLRRMQTDIGRITEAARQSQTPLPFLSVLANIYTSASHMPNATGDQLDAMRWIADNAGAAFAPSASAPES